MPKAPKPRSVAFFPYVRCFKPSGVPLAELEEEVITVEELEALRLKDLEGLDQDSCAEKMGISQSTFQRLLAGARFKLARALIEGRAIRVEGGNFQLAGTRLRCLDCGEEWEGVATETGDVVCPRCGRGPVVVQTHFGPLGRLGYRHRHGPPWRW